MHFSIALETAFVQRYTIAYTVVNNELKGRINEKEERGSVSSSSWKIFRGQFVKYIVFIIACWLTVRGSDSIAY